jgi:Bacterial Ig-like domain (group 1)/Glucodextranase, domain B
MTTRRDHRRAHVRPRPPSTGRPAPVKVKPRSPGTTRLSGHRPVKRNRGLPLIFRVGLVAAVFALGFGVIYLGAGGLGVVVGGIGSTVGGFVSGVTSTPSPRPTIASITDPPSLQQPSEPYTSEPTVDLVVTTPAGVGGNQAYKIRVYLTLPDQAPTAIQDAAVSATARTVIPGVELTDGVNDFTVTIIGPAGESEPSLMVRYVLDAAPPKITITSPKANAIVNGKAVSIKGKTQARTTLLARNEANGSSIAGTAESDGTFTISLALSPGVNKIAITGTDPAGNVTETILSVRRGSGELAVSLGASIHQIKRSRLPEPITLTATVTDPDGNPLAGADVTFTLSIPGVGPITRDTKTEPNGKASFKTTVPRGADLGQGSATVLVSSSEFGSTQDHTVISIVR